MFAPRIPVFIQSRFSTTGNPETPIVLYLTRMDTESTVI